MSDLSSCQSLKSAMLVLVCGEVGFLGVNPMPYAKLVYSFNLFISNIGRKLEKQDYTDEYCNFHKVLISGEVISPSFSIDYKKDLVYLHEIVSKNKSIASLSGELDEWTINMMVSNIFDQIGKIMNKDDDYFFVLTQLWKTIDKDEKFYHIIKDDRLKRVSSLLRLSEDRMNALLAI